MIVDLKGVESIDGPQRVGKGLYVLGHWNFEFYALNRLVEKTYSREESDAELAEMRAGTWISEFGVCDSPEQFMETVGVTLESRPDNYVVSFVQVRRDEEPEEGGWRWHKWGPYVGKQKRLGCEYLYDEKEIEAVYTYCFHKVKPE